MSRSIPTVLLAAVSALLLCAGSARAEVRDTSVPDNFVSMYMGFNKLSNTNVKTTGDDASWIGQTAGKSFSLEMRNLQMKNSVWGGMGFGHWFKQAPVSIGLSGTMDFFPAVVKEQTSKDFTSIVGGVDTSGSFVSYTKYQTDLFQIVPAVNLLIGVPLKFARVYGGIGPGLFMSMYSLTIKSGSAVTGYATAFDTKIGYNAFFGSDFFISQHWSAFVEGKYSQVDGLAFSPSSSQTGGRHITETFKSLVTQRLAVGASYHF